MKIFLILFLFSTLTYGESLKIINFNTMCDLCKGSNYFDFDNRLNSLIETLKNHDADIMSLQELRSIDHAKTILKNFENYGLIVNTESMISFADPSIIYNKNKLKLIESGQIWLTPSDSIIPLGWKFSFPRQVIWGKFQFDGGELIFLSTHFDNRIENLQGSVKLITEYFKNETLPIIFAGDTNITDDMPEYKAFSEGGFTNIFDIKKSFTVKGEYLSDKDICYLKKGKIFPACRVEHIFLKNFINPKINSFTIDARKNYNGLFNSDHRPVIIELEFN